MEKIKGPVLITSFVLAAFIWGLGKDSITLWAHNLKSSLAFSSASKLPSGNPSSADAQSLAVNQESAFKNPEATGLHNFMPAGDSPGTAQRHLNQASNQRPGRPAPGNLSETLDAIQPGAVTDEQITRRNAYFEKLAQQLKKYDRETETPAPRDQAAADQNTGFEPGAPMPEVEISEEQSPQMMLPPRSDEITESQEPVSADPVPLDPEVN